MKNSLLVVLSILVLAAMACVTPASMAAEAPAATETIVATATPAGIIPVTGATETPVSTATATEAPVEMQCTTAKEDLQNYLEVSSTEAFEYNQVPSSFGGHRYVIAITYKDGSHAIVYGEANTLWTADQTIATAMVNLIHEGGYETKCLANGFAEAVKPSLGEIPVMMIP